MYRIKPFNQLTFPFHLGKNSPVRPKIAGSGPAKTLVWCPYAGFVITLSILLVLIWSKGGGKCHGDVHMLNSVIVCLVGNKDVPHKCRQPSIIIGSLEMYFETIIATYVYTCACIYS